MIKGKHFCHWFLIPTWSANNTPPQNIFPVSCALCRLSGTVRQSFQEHVLLSFIIHPFFLSRCFLCSSYSSLFISQHTWCCINPEIKHYLCTICVFRNPLATILFWSSQRIFPFLDAIADVLPTRVLLAPDCIAISTLHYLFLKHACWGTKQNTQNAAHQNDQIIFYVFSICRIFVSISTYAVENAISTKKFVRVCRIISLVREVYGTIAGMALCT